MNLWYEPTLFVHALAGAVGLAAFWIPALTQKGSRIHRAAGRWFVRAMLGVGLTAVPLTARFYVEGQWEGATFLGYLFVITMTAVGLAWYALKLKRSPERFYGPVHLAVAWLNLITGVIVLGLGLANGVVLLTLFSAVGLVSGTTMLRNRRGAHRDANWWLLEHLNGMIGGGIAAHIAFGAFGLRRIWPAYAGLEGPVALVPWLAPLVVGLVVAAVASRRYRGGVPPPRAIGVPAEAP